MIEIVKRQYLPCEGVAVKDTSCYYPSYRCTVCFCVIGSVGMPTECYELWKKSFGEEIK